MKGLTGLVSAAELLAEAAGSRAGAVRAAVDILSWRNEGLPRGHDDVAVAARQELVEQGVITAAGVVDAGRAAELVSVCQILAAASIPAPSTPPDPRLVLSAPADAVPLRDNERLEGLVLDVIRLASTSLHIGGAFWNEDGFGLLEEVLRPALADRNIPTIIYANVPDIEAGVELTAGQSERFVLFLEQLEGAGLFSAD